MAIEEAIYDGKDGVAASSKVGYSVHRETKYVGSHQGGRGVPIIHSVQRISLLLAVEEQTKPPTAEEGIMKLAEDEKPAAEQDEDEAVKTLVEKEAVYLARLKVFYFNFLKVFYVCLFSNLLSTFK